MNVENSPKRRWRVWIVLVIIGISASFFARSGSGASWLMLLTDTLFAVSMTFFCFGLMCMVSNMGMFDSTVYGAKTLARLMRNRLKPAPNQEDGFLAYVKSRPHRAGVKSAMLIAAALGALSGIVAFLAV